MSTRMSLNEKLLWRAAYAAAFVSDFERMYEAAQNGRTSQERLNEYSFDVAVRCTTAERAVTIADRAVKELREWQTENDPKSGEFA